MKCWMNWKCENSLFIKENLSFIKGLRVKKKKKKKGERKKAADVLLGISNTFMIMQKLQSTTGYLPRVLL